MYWYLYRLVMLILTLIKGVQHCELLLDLMISFTHYLIDRIRGNRGFVSVLYRDGV